MFYQVVYFFLLCFLLYSTSVLSDVRPKFDDIIQNSLTVNFSKTDDCILDVTFKETANCKVCIKNNLKHNISFDKAYAFYTAMSCKFASYVFSSITHYIQSARLISRLKMAELFANTPKKLKKSENFENHINSVKPYIKERVGRLINIINDYLDEYSKSSYYFDTLILETLTSLHVQLEYLSLDIESPYLNVIRLFLKHLTALQSVILMNCSYKHSINNNNNNTILFWYWIHTDEVDGQELTKFLSSIEEFEIGSDRPNYTSTQTFLEMFVDPLSNNDNVIGEIACPDVERVHSEQTSVSVKDFLYRVRISCDFELILFYQNFVLATMIKRFFDKMSLVLQREQLPQVVAKEIKDLNEVVFDDRTNFPAYLIDGFSILDKCVTETQRSSLLKLRTLVNELKIAVGKGESEETSSSEYGMKYLQETLTTIAEKVNDLKLFTHTSRKSLRVNHYTYFTMPKINFIPVTFPLARSEIDRFGQVCKFISSMHTMCHKVLGIAREKRNAPYFANRQKKLNPSDVVFETLTKIQNYFIIFIKYADYDVNVLKMALKITPLLVNMLNQSKKDIDKNVTTVRILDLIITELKNSGMHYCAPAETHILLYNEVEDLKDGDDKTFDDEMMDLCGANFFNVPVSGFPEMIIDTKEYHYFNLKNFYANHIKKSNVYKSYEKIVQVYWKGQLKTINDVYQDVSSFLVNPHNFYALQDMSYKFYIAVVYYEILNIMTSSNLDKYKNDIIKQLTYFHIRYFPELLKPLIGDILELLELSDENSTQRFTLRLNIDAQFKQFNICFAENSSSSFVTGKFNKYKVKLMPSYQNDELMSKFKVLNGELYENFLSKHDFKEFTIRN